MADKIAIQILNRDYYVDDKGDPLYMTALARYVQEKMEEVGNKSNIVDTSRLAVHAALSIADEFFQVKEKIDKFEGVSSYRVDKLIGDLEKVL